VRVKRRFTPPKPASALRIASPATPSSCATAIAAVAFEALCRPGIGSVMSEISCAAPVLRLRITTLNLDPPVIGERSVKRTSACGFSP
jgi:hypothetical protein